MQSESQISYIAYIPKGTPRVYLFLFTFYIICSIINVARRDKTMVSGIIFIIVGALIVVFGILNICGVISPVHFFYGNDEKKQKAFSKRIGIGLIITGSSVFSSAVLMVISDIMAMQILTNIAFFVMLAGLLVGLAFTIILIKIYNKRTF